MIQFLNFETHLDPRGELVAIESSKNIPFDIKRIYYLFKNQPQFVRAQHAHKKLKQVYIAVCGSCKMMISDGAKKEIVTLNDPIVGVFFTEIIWRELFDFSSDCVLMVLADDFYKEEDYIKNYDEFINFKKLEK
jgi:hypothetical protein